MKLGKKSGGCFVGEERNWKGDTNILYACMEITSNKIKHGDSESAH